jgi:hypothetical protein
MGILAPHLKEIPTVIATNITSRDILLLLTDARLKQFEKEYGVEVTGDEVRFLTPADGALALNADSDGSSDLSVEIANGESTLQLLERTGQLSGVGAASPVMERIVGEGISLVPATAAPEAAAA